MATIIEGVSHLDRDELANILSDESSEVIVLDVREVDEYVAGHIPGVPLIPMGALPELIDHFDASREYVFVCRSGARSLKVAQFFQSAGFDKVHNYEGGMLAWDRDFAQGEEHIIEEFSMDALKRK